jgi:PII-like signaling protein
MAHRGGIVTADALKLTVYFGERDRLDGHLTSDVLLDLYEWHDVKAAILLRATEGFGIKHRLHTQRMLTLSEDLPLVSVAVDTRETIQRLVPRVQDLVGGGLVTIERARVLTRFARTEHGAAATGDATKLTLYLGRQERVGDRRAHALAVEVLRRHGVAGATVLLGVDGLLHHTRKRARFLSRNADVPLMVVSVGSSESIRGALAELDGQLDDPLATLERVRVCKRDGVTVAPPAPLPETDPSGLGIWQKLMVYTGEQARHRRHPLYVELIHRLRLEGAAGATAVRGIWGYSGDHAPHGDVLLAVRRRVPVVLTLVDRPARIQEWWRFVDEMTSEQGLVTSEMVPAVRAVGPSIASGGLRLARLEP